MNLSRANVILFRSIKAKKNMATLWEFVILTLRSKLHFLELIKPHSDLCYFLLNLWLTPSAVLTLNWDNKKEQERNNSALQPGIKFDFFMNRNYRAHTVYFVVELWRILL